MTKDVKKLVWDLFENSGLTQYYAMYLALKQNEELERREKERQRQ